MTPRQLSLLFARHREALVHREMVSALTTAAVINHGPYPPRDYVPWTAFSPHHKGFTTSSEDKLTDAQRQIINDHNVRVLEMTASMKAEAKCQTTSPDYAPS